LVIAEGEKPINVGAKYGTSHADERAKKVSVLIGLGLFKICTHPHSGL